jgi:hypothetical protein
MKSIDLDQGKYPFPRHFRPPSSLIVATRDRNRRIGLGTGALEIEATVAHPDSIPAQQAQPVDAARGAGQGTVLRQGEDDSGRATDEVEEGAFRRRAVRLGRAAPPIYSSLIYEGDGQSGQMPALNSSKLIEIK